MLAACLYPDIVREFPHVRDMLFMSTVDPNEEFSFTHVDNTVTGYVTELERCAQSSDVMGTQRVQTNPYSTRLMPVSNQDDVLQIETGVLLEEVLFIGFDATLSGSIYQNADNNTAIEGSQTSVSDAYVASHFRNGVHGNWQPNYCRPEIRVNSIPILTMGDSHVTDPVTGGRGHMGHLSIGVVLPHRVAFYTTFERVRSIDVYCGLAQWITTSGEPTDRLVRYPVLCLMRWRTR